MPYNILFLMTDQHRADHVGFVPGGRMATPNLDRLAGSVAFSRCLTVDPICTPARVALLTGKYAHQVGMLSMSGDLSLEHPTYLRALQAAGYWTAGVGKFHWLQNWPWGTVRGGGHDLVALRPEIRKYGLDYVWEAAGKQLAHHNYCDYGAYLRERGLLEAYRDHIERCGPNAMDPAATRWTGAPWPFDEEHYIDAVIGREIERALDLRPKDRPFFLFGSFCGPHKPYDPPASFLEAIPPDEADDFIPGAVSMGPELKRRLYRVRRAYRAMIGLVDREVGRILERLERDGVLDTTVILFTSDHGEMLGDHGRMSKMQPWRQSVEVPTAIQHPAHLGGRVCRMPVEITDLTATMLDVAGLRPEEALSKRWPAFHDRVPCRSLMPVVRGESEGVRRYAFSECNGTWELVQGERWKYVRMLGRTADESPGEALYDLEADPTEQHDRSADPECRAVLDELRDRRQRIMDSTPPAQLGWARFAAQG